MSKLVNIHTHHPTGSDIEPVTVGIHPWDAARRDISEVEAALPGADLVGEIGLDSLCGVKFERQLALFREQLALAERLQKPVILHCVRTFEPIMNELAKHSLRAVIFHGFTGSPAQAKRALARGYFLSFGERTFRSPKSIESLQQTPMQQLFIENDESPTPIAEIYARIASLRGIGIEQLAEAVRANFMQIFGR